jgi:hypothetical protein
MKADRGLLQVDVSGGSDGAGLEVRVYNLEQDATEEAKAKYTWNVRTFMYTTAGEPLSPKLSEHGFPLTLGTNDGEQILAFDSQVELHEWVQRLLRMMVQVNVAVAPAVESCQFCDAIMPDPNNLGGFHKPACERFDPAGYVAPAAAISTDTWFFKGEDQQEHGPMTLAELQALIATDSREHVFYPGPNGWQAITKVPELDDSMVSLQVTSERQAQEDAVVASNTQSAPPLENKMDDDIENAQWFFDPATGEPHKVLFSTCLTSWAFSFQSVMSLVVGSLYRAPSHGSSCKTCSKHTPN